MGLTQIDMADALGVNQSTISRIETGEMPLDQRTQLAIEALMMRHGIHASSSTSIDTVEWPLASPGKSDDFAAQTAQDL